MKNLKRSLAPLLAVLMVMALVLPCFAGEEAAAFAGGSGTAEDPYQIASVGQLELVREDLGAAYVLAADIDLSGYENWIPIGDMRYGDVDMETGEMDLSKAFSGSFDGAGYRIFNVRSQAEDDMLCVGLFGAFTGSLQNLVVEDLTVVGTEYTMAAGGVVGYAIAGSIEGVRLAGGSSVTGTVCVGGIAGGSCANLRDCAVEDAEIIVVGDNDFSEGLIQCDVAECGGLVVGGSFMGRVDGCSATGTVSATGNEPVGLGGIAGCIQCIDSISGNSVTATINAANGHAIGGLCGYAGIGDDGDGVVDAPCAITDCSANITINAQGATHVGGLVGTGLYFYGMEDRFSVENCRVSGSINGAVTPGAVAGRAEGSLIISCETQVLVDGEESGTLVGSTDCMYESADQHPDGSELAAARLLDALSGSYEALFPVILHREYAGLWLELCSAAVGEEDAVAVADMLRYTCAGEIYGEEAAAAYAADPGSILFDCGFHEGLANLLIDGSTISGFDQFGRELFSHSYSYIGYDESLGFYQFQSDDGEAGEFTFFSFAPDTMARTYHLEFRYGSDLDALSELYTGPYAYWLAAAIEEGAPARVIENCITLFCTENLQG